MKTIALRFGEHFSPKCGTIKAHQLIIEQNGYVWYGKLGSAVSMKVQNIILNNEEKKILLIRSGKAERYWAYISEISDHISDIENIPEYYRDKINSIKTWFKVYSFQQANNDVMSCYIVSSSREKLGNVSKHSMSPYFIIEKEDNDGMAK